MKNIFRVISFLEGVSYLLLLFIATPIKYLQGDASFKAVHKDDFLGGVTVVETEFLIREDRNEEIYQAVTKPTFKKHKSQLVPYYAWSNRGQAEMTVFTPVVWNN